MEVDRVAQEAGMGSNARRREESPSRRIAVSEIEETEGISGSAADITAGTIESTIGSRTFFAKAPCSGSDGTECNAVAVNAKRRPEFAAFAREEWAEPRVRPVFRTKSEEAIVTACWKGNSANTSRESDRGGGIEEPEREVKMSKDEAAFESVERLVLFPRTAERY